jgi:hypothetical protein
VECNLNYNAESIERMIIVYGYFIRDFERAENYSVKELKKYIEYISEIKR